MWLAAAAEPPSSGDSTQIILGVIGLLSAVLVVAVGGVFQLLSAKANRTSPAPPPPTPLEPSDGLGMLRERVAVLERRADDSDERDEIQDRRHEQVERHLDLENPEWRHDGR